VIDGHIVDFNRCPLEARLLYDCDDLKEVGFVKSKPMEYKCHVNEKGDQVTVELRVKVLTSQLEDSHFRIKFVAVEQSSKENIESICAISESIKVVSKPEQVKKKKPLADISQPKKKRNINDVLVDTLVRIESTCLQQQQSIAKVIEQQEIQQMHNNALIQSLFATSLGSMNCEKLSDSGKLKKETPNEFEVAFQKFVEAYNKIQTDERPEKIRRLIRTSPTKETHKFTELLELFGAEGVHVDASTKHKKPLDNSDCCCAECPHKRELEKIDDFYNEFLSSPTALM